MDLKTYHKNAVRTIKAERHSDYLLAHWGLGLAEEAAEAFDAVAKLVSNDDGVFNTELYASIRTEIGDVCWHVVAVLEFFGRNLSDAQDSWDRPYTDPKTKGQAFQTAAALMMTAAKDVAGSVKKAVFYERPKSKILVLENTIAVFDIACQLCHVLELDLGEVLQQNITKLALKYPKGHFTYEDAQAAEDEKEIN